MAFELEEVFAGFLEYFDKGEGAEAGLVVGP